MYKGNALSLHKTGTGEEVTEFTNDLETFWSLLRRKPKTPGKGERRQQL